MLPDVYCAGCRQGFAYRDYVDGHDECPRCRPTDPLPAVFTEGQLVLDGVGGRWVYHARGCTYIAKDDYVESGYLPTSPTARQKEIFHLMRGSGNPHDFKYYGKPADAIVRNDPPVYD